MLSIKVDQRERTAEELISMSVTMPASLLVGLTEAARVRRYALSEFVLLSLNSCARKARRSAGSRP